MTRKHVCLTVFGVLIAVVSQCSTVVAERNADPLATLREQHPRLLFTVSDEQRVRSLMEDDALLKKLVEQNRVNANPFSSWPNDPIRARRRGVPLVCK